jgi:hypothetical protein
VGAPTAADKAQLIAIMSGDYRYDFSFGLVLSLTAFLDYSSKKEVAHILIPAVGRKVYDLGGNLEKGMISLAFKWEVTY